MWTFFLISLPLRLPGIIAGVFLGLLGRSGFEFVRDDHLRPNIPGETQTIASCDV